MQRTTERHVRGVVIAAAAAAMLLAGCGGDNEEPSGLDADTSTPSAPADTGTPDESETDPTAGSDAATPTTHEFPEAGVTVEAPAAASEVERAALAAYVEFTRQWRKSLRDVQLSETLPSLAAGPVIADVESSLSYQEENGIRYGGEIVFTPTIEDSSEKVVVLGGCVDGSKLTLIDDGEEKTPKGIDEHPVVPMQVVVANGGAGWMVNENTLHEEQSC